jgi:hypothetical protein
LLATSDCSEQLFSVSVMQKLQETFRLLPTKDFEFNFLADYFMFTNQILTVIENLTNLKQAQAFVQSLCMGLKFHMLPYLYEVRVSGFEEELYVQHSPRLLFLIQFLDLLISLARADVSLRKKNRTPSIFAETVLSSHLIGYLMDLNAVLKDKLEHKSKILQLLSLVTGSFDTRKL